MLFGLFQEKKLKMVWQARKGGLVSYLVGTAHFFPHSFKASLTRLIEKAETCIFEGPLDEASMRRVVEAGYTGDRNWSLLQELDAATISSLARTVSPNLSKESPFHDLILRATQSSLSELVKGMKPWMAFFTIYSTFLETLRWKHSVDMEAFEIAKALDRRIVPLETIEEQIEVLDTIDRQQIIEFLKRVTHWKKYTSDFVRWYLSGNLDKIASNPYGFPTRNPSVIDRRDRILFERMLGHLDRGNAVVCVGVPHIVGISGLLVSKGYELTRYGHSHTSYR